MNGVIPAWLVLLAALALVAPPMPTGHPLETDGDTMPSGCVWSARLQGRKFDESGQRVCKTDALVVAPPLTGKSGTGMVTGAAICNFTPGGDVSAIVCDRVAIPYGRY